MKSKQTERRGATAEDQRAKQTQAAFAVMEDEAREEYMEYLKRCGGTAISTIKPE